MPTAVRAIDPALTFELERLLTRVAELEGRETALRELETSLRKRLAALTEPLEGGESPQLHDLADLDQIQALQDAFAEATGVASIITDVRGVPITRPSRFCRLCLHVIRGTPRGLANCMASDAALGRRANGPILQPCLSGGLLDGGASISVGDRHIANWLIGQVIDEGSDPQRLLDYASEIGADREEFRAALAEVTRMPRKRFESVGRALFLFAETISRLAYHNHQQARHIAEREQTEKALKESEERYRSLFQSSGDAIVATDLGGRFTDANPAALRLLGYTREEMLALTYRQVTPARWHAAEEAILRSIANRGYTEEYEKEYVRKDGTAIPISVRAFVKMDLAGNLVGAWGIVRDMSEWKRAEEERERLKSRLHRAAKMEAIGQLAGGIAHDFNNLLTVILSGAEALRHDSALGLPTDTDVVGEIAGAGDRARDLTRQLLAFARRQVIAPVPLDLNALLRSSEKLLRRVLGEDVELTVTVQPDLWHVRCDPGQVEQVVLNLAVNARDAMPGGGKLTLSTANVEVDERLTASRPWMHPGSYVKLAIRDSGQGMSPEVKAHLFEPFFTTKPVGKGTGLGLATVYGIVKQNDGYILVESEPGQGTKLELFFPRMTGTPVEASPPAPAIAPRGTETVLVVEDEPAVREVTVRCLRSGGYRVLVARDGQEALEIAARELGRLHLLVTDVVMPGMDGRALANELRRDHLALRVLYVSGYSEEVIAKRGVLEPGVELLPKPFTPSSLLARVRAVLDLQ